MKLPIQASIREATIYCIKETAKWIRETKFCIRETKKWIRETVTTKQGKKTLGLEEITSVKEDFESLQYPNSF